MKPRAVIFDIYKTILTVAPPPKDAEARWKDLWKTTIRTSRAMSLDEFGKRCRIVIDREHAAARSRGIQFPEVFWPDVVSDVLPPLRKLTPRQRDDFQLRQVGLWHTTSLAPGAKEVLRRLVRARIPLGIVSNCQPYTLRELDEALSTARLRRKIFSPSLCFLSFDHGFSKPDPHVFRLLTARLAARGIAPEDALVVGDREDNDAAPAKAQGFQTWKLTPDAASGRAAGNWPQLGVRLASFQ